MIHIHTQVTRLSRPAGFLMRFAAFGTVGTLTFLLGIGLQGLLTGIWHQDAVTSFVCQGIVSVEFSYLLNWRWTWRTEAVPFWRSWLRFHGQKVVTILANVAVYAALVRLGVNYLAANVATTALFTAVNYAAAHLWAFRRADPAREHAGTPAPHPATRGAPAVPTASVIVPCRASEQTIRDAVDSLLGQDYPGLIEVILVGSTGDTTWQALRDVTDPRLVILEREATPYRDSNAKRDFGVLRSRGDVVALADSDMVMRPDWLSRGVDLLSATASQCVAGGMTSAHDSFWGRFVDGTRMAAKTPRVSRAYTVTRENFGSAGRKPPITANVIFTRDVYRQCPLDTVWTAGYEDYEWFWRMARAGYQITVSNELSGQHHHRRGLRQLCQEYRRSGDGCARFILRYPGCPLARKRLRQAVVLPVAGLALVLATAWMTGPVVPLAAVGLIAAASVGCEYRHQRSPEALLYPFLNVTLASAFLFTMLKTLVSSAGAARAASQRNPDPPAEMAGTLSGCAGGSLIAPASKGAS